MWNPEPPTGEQPKKRKLSRSKVKKKTVKTVLKNSVLRTFGLTVLFTGLT
jgi:hypothetical protein